MRPSSNRVGAPANRLRRGNDSGNRSGTLRKLGATPPRPSVNRLAGLRGSQRRHGSGRSSCDWSLRGGGGRRRFSGCGDRRMNRRRLDRREMWNYRRRSLGLQDRTTGRLGGNLGFPVGPNGRPQDERALRRGRGLARRGLASRGSCGKRRGWRSAWFRSGRRTLRLCFERGPRSRRWRGRFEITRRNFSQRSSNRGRLGRFRRRGFRSFPEVRLDPLSQFPFNGTGMRPLVLDSEFGQVVEDRFRFHLEFPGQFVNSHRPFPAVYIVDYLRHRARPLRG